MYQSDLSNKEWALIEHHFKPEDPRGSAHKHSKKLIVDAILYVVKGGITWRMLPNDFPSWKTVYDHFSGSLVVPGFNNFMIIMQIIHIPSGR